MNKKGQSELLGLVVIVLIFSLLLLFVLTFLIGQSDDSVRQVYLNEQAGSSFVNSMLRTNMLECTNNDMGDILIDCYTEQRIACQGFANTCDFFANKSKEFLESTLDVWGFTYAFYVVDNSTTIDYYSAGDDLKTTNAFGVVGEQYGCDYAEELEPFRQPLPLLYTGRSVTIHLDIC